MPDTCQDFNRRLRRYRKPNAGRIRMRVPRPGSARAGSPIAPSHFRRYPVILTRGCPILLAAVFWRHGGALTLLTQRGLPLR
jgi:hypothetical protein